MPIRNAEVAAVFEEIADLLEIEDANPFRVRAYRNAARTVAETGRDLSAIREGGDEFPHLRGIGKDLAGKIEEILATGTCAQLTTLRSELPPAITELLQIPGLGPRRVQALYHGLGVKTLDQLASAAQEGRIRTLPGFGETLERRIREAVQARLERTQRRSIVEVAPEAEALVEWLGVLAGVGHVTLAGSFRRCRDTVGDLDVLVTARRGIDVGAHFTAWSHVVEVLARGPTRAAVRLRGGLQVDLRVVTAASYGAALHYFTGSKPHNIHVRRMGQEQGLKINEYGVFQAEARIAGRTEESVFQAVGLPFIPPELREDRGEIEAALAGTLPTLVELREVKGDLHVHTRASDGLQTVDELAAAAVAHRLHYLGIADRLGTGGFSPQALAAQVDDLDQRHRKAAGVTLLAGVELPIAVDGSLPELPAELLDRLDFVLVALHDHLDLPRAQQTRRLVTALARPRVAILAHPTGRMWGERPACDLDLEAVLAACKRNDVAVECNAHPRRLDLDDQGCRAAGAADVRVAVAADVRTGDDLARLHWAVGQARRGWLTPGDVLNTRTVTELRRLLRRK